MARGSSSQVGLFSTQISEQIVRLRALSQGQDGPTEAHQVDLRRAVMATRLLAGSARVMKLEVLQQFLDELLEWLQRMEQSKRPLNTTQSLILESVVELEESLMLDLDEADPSQGVDLSPFQAQIDELLTLIRHNVEKIDALAQPRTAAPVEEPAETSEPAPATLTSLLDAFEDSVASATTAEELRRLDSELAPVRDRLKAVHLDLQRRLTAFAPPAEPLLADRGLAALDGPEDDPLLGPAIARLHERAEALDLEVVVEAYGGSDLLATTLHERVAEILVHLVDDALIAVESERDREAHTRLRVALAVTDDLGRVRIEIADDAPRVHGAPLLGDPDHLSMLGGLRRARTLLEQTQGTIRVAPADRAPTRFELSVPRDPELPAYRVLHLEGTPVAVPAALVDEVIDAAGLLYETDESGESVEHDGRSVPLADLAQFIDEIAPGRGPSPRIAVLGSVEKRMGLGCEDTSDELVLTSELLDAPRGWTPVAYGAIEGPEGIVPVLDVRRLLELRFRLHDALDLSGALVDPRVDTFVPADDDGDDAVEFEPEVETVEPDVVDEVLEPEDESPHERSFRTALLVNQSEFRRRDLGRTLETLGIEVEVADDLRQASRRIERREIDLLVTDLRLGQKGGASFHTLREKHPELTIVLTSSVSKQYAAELAQKTGADRCWLDPYRKSDLEALLAELKG